MRKLRGLIAVLMVKALTVVEPRAIKIHDVLSTKNGSSADLRDANFKSADLRDADFKSADLRDADFSSVNLRNANLSSVNLRNANLRYADLSFAHLSFAILSFTDFSSANLSFAVLRHANLAHADFSYASLTNADFSYASLRDANLTGANLTGANLSGTTGLLAQVDWIKRNGEPHPDGYIFYKTFQEVYPRGKGWEVRKGAIIEETVNYTRTQACGCGINIATAAWILANTKQATVWRVLVRWEDLAGVCVPYATEGQIRAERVLLVDRTTRAQLEREHT